MDLTFAINKLEESSANLDSKWKGIIQAAKKFSDNIHYSLMIVLSQNPDKQSKDAKKRVDTFINSFSDLVSGYKNTDKLFNLAVKAIGWDGGKVYNVISVSILNNIIHIGCVQAGSVQDYLQVLNSSTIVDAIFLLKYTS